MKKLIVYGALIFASATALVACDNKGGDSAAPITPPSCVAPNYINNGVCVAPNGVDITQPATFVDSTKYSLVSGGWTTGQMRITNSFVFKQFLKSAMATCDRWSGSNGGNAGCDTYMTGNFSVVMTVSSLNTNQATLQFKAEQVPTYGYWTTGYQTPLAMQNPMFLSNAPLSIINNYAGFDISRTVNLYTVQLIVSNGKLSDTSINYELAYGNQATVKGQVFATGTLTRSY